ncbi:MAG: shikimate dehydrogenase [Pirellulales bacterium]|nr:shikimate dehydrogenase [Pirellulales bacterium]
MLCVSIGRGRHRHMIAEHAHLAQQGIKLVELRLDYINGPVNLKRLLPERPTPTVITCRRLADGGKWRGTEEQRLLLLRTAIVEGVEYVDLEEDIAGGIPRYGKTKRIVSFHDFRRTPDDLDEIWQRLAKLQPDIIKIATMANNPHDNIRMLKLLARHKSIPTVGMCMGDMGTPSRILSQRHHPPFVFATFHQERLLAPGQLSYQQMTEVYRHEQLNAQTTVYGVIGDPIGHSLSPLIHNAAFQHLGLNAVYVPFRVPAENLDQFLSDHQEWGLHGLSVTIPHKEAVLKKITKLEPTVQGMGAANTLIYQGDTIQGHNTDCQAAIESLEKAMVPPLYDRGGLQGKLVLVLGAGGAARAIVHGLKQQGALVNITSRTHERSQALAEKFGAKAISWDNRYGITPDVVVNCTPVGMHPNVDDTPYEKHHMRPFMVIFDTVYNPENTLLIKDARNQGCVTVTGVEMFIRQAALQFKLFTGKEPPVEVMRETLKRAIGPAKM